MPLPRIIHRIWIGSAPTELQIMNLLDARQYVQGNIELWLWTNRSATLRALKLKRNVVIHNLDALWVEYMDSPFSLVKLRAAFERESRGTFHNFASARPAYPVSLWRRLSGYGRILQEQWG